MAESTDPFTLVYDAIADALLGHAAFAALIPAARFQRMTTTAGVVKRAVHRAPADAPMARLMPTDGPNQTPANSKAIEYAWGLSLEIDTVAPGELDRYLLPVMWHAAGALEAARQATPPLGLSFCREFNPTLASVTDYRLTEKGGWGAVVNMTAVLVIPTANVLAGTLP